VLRYVKGTRKFRISYLTLEKRLRIKGYVDSDYAKDLVDRKLTYGFVFMLLGGLLAWCSRKQRSVFTLTTKVEYVALC
jgi:hypothetical protein